MVKAELEQTRKVQETTANRDQLKSELERLQRRQQEMGRGKERKTTTPIEPLLARSRPELKMEMDEAPRASGRFNLDKVAQEQISEDLETRTSPDLTPSLRDLELSGVRPLIVDVALPNLMPSSTGGSQARTGTSRLKELQERLQSRTPESRASEGKPHTWRKQPARSI